MKLHYEPETDSPYIELTDMPGSGVTDVADGLVLDVDAPGNPVGIDIGRAARTRDLSAVETVALPAAPPHRGARSE
jgi:uncharacterized protein YuzE